MMIAPVVSPFLHDVDCKTEYQSFCYKGQVASQVHAKILLPRDGSIMAVLRIAWHSAHRLGMMTAVDPCGFNAN